MNWDNDSEVERILRRKMRELMKEKAQRETQCPRGEINANRKIFYELLHKCDIVVADFWAEWCGPCRFIEPIVSAIAEKYAGKVPVLKVNVDENPDLATECGVASIPTIIIFYKGREYRRFVGFHPLIGRQISAEINSLVS